MKKIFNKTIYALTLSAIVIIAICSCKVRDDYPVFEEREDEVIEDIIPEDNDISPVSQKIKAGTTYFKEFLMDSTIIVSKGLEYTHLRFISNIDQKVSMHIVEVDRTKGDFTMQVLSPFGDYLYATGQELPEMMQMNESKVSSGKRILAAIVGGDIGTPVAGKPNYTFVQNERVITTDARVTYPAFGVRKSNGALEVMNTYDALVVPKDPIVAKDYSQLISGTNWMLYYGREVTYSTTTKVARTAIGFSADMQKIYLITVDGVNKFSDGITLNDFRTVYKALGCSSAFYTAGTTKNAMAIKSKKVTKTGYELKNIPDAAKPLPNYAIGIIAKD